MAIWLSVMLIAPALAQEDTAESLPTAHWVDLARLTHAWETFNNCGPATLTMALGYYGYPDDAPDAQQIAAAYLKPNRNDGSVSFWQMVDYVNEVTGPDYGLQAVFRRGGSLDLLRRLLANDFPVVLGKGLELSGPGMGWFGHYVLAVGYDDDAQMLYTYDSQKGYGDSSGLPQEYAYIQRTWQQFNNVFLVIYDVEREAELQALMGTLWDEQSAWESALIAAEANLAANPDDLWAVFNVAEINSYLGNYAVATAAYDVALFERRGLPFRTLWYMQGAFRAYYATGQFRRVLDLTGRVQAETPHIEDMNYYRGLVHAARGEAEAARERFLLVLDFNPNFYPAAEALAALEAGTFVGPVEAP
ncbi:MAG: C39 family peptidase [Anaerolineae bacterium]|nr:C39 family peptidase [Anaerolineae bacterium]